MAIDEEIQALAFHALKNQFWHDFSGLVNAYLKAAEGLEVEGKDYHLQEMTSVFGRNKADFRSGPSIYTINGAGVAHIHETMREALELQKVKCIYLNGREVFHRLADGEWYFTEQGGLT